MVTDAKPCLDPEAVFAQRPIRSVALLMIGACIGSIAVTAAYLLLGLVRVS